MANILVTATGNWSAGGTWVGGTPPGAGDTAVANGKTVTIDQNVTCVALVNDTTGGATAGGSFAASNAGKTITANITANTVACLVVSANTTIVGNSTGGSSSNAYGINWSAGNLTFTGNSYGGSAGGAHGIFANSSGTLSYTGNQYGGSSGSASGVYVQGNMTMTVTGNMIGGSGSNSSGGMVVISNATLSMTGNCIGGTTATAFGFNFNGSGGTCTINGTAYATAGHGIYVNPLGSASIYVTKAVGNSYGPSSATQGIAIFGIYNLNNVASVYVTSIEYGSLGNSPTYGPIILNPSTSNTAVMYLGPGLPAISTATGSAGTGTITFASNHGLSTSNSIILAGFASTDNLWNGTKVVTVTSATVVTISGPTATPTIIGNAVNTTSTKTLVDGNSTGLLPATTDVRYLTVYNAGNNVGSLHVPAAGSVDLGVLVDATTGTAVLTAASVQTALTSQGYTTTRAGYLDNLDATVSSRLATSVYTAPNNTSIAAIKAKTDNLPSSPAPSGDTSGLTSYGAAKASDVTTATSGLSTLTNLDVEQAIIIGSA